MIPIVCIVGASNAGKTTVLERLIPELAGKGYRVGALKHDAHGFQMDHEGKDTWKHKRAGAQTIAISSPSQVASIRSVTSEMSLEDVVGRYFWSENIVLVEGYKRSHYPKIEVFRSAIEHKPICKENDNLMAVISEDEIALDVPRFGFEEIDRAAALIEERFLASRREHAIQVLLDGKRLPMNSFVQEFMAGAIMGMLGTLRGWKKPQEIRIQLRPEDME